MFDFNWKYTFLENLEIFSKKLKLFIESEI